MIALLFSLSYHSYFEISFVEGGLYSCALFLGRCEAPRLCNGTRCSTLAYVAHPHPDLAAVLSGPNNFANISKDPFLVVL